MAMDSEEEEEIQTKKRKHKFREFFIFKIKQSI